MNTLILSTFDCSFEDFDKFVADFHEMEGHKYVEEYELIKVNEHKSHLILPEICFNILNKRYYH